MAFIPTPNLSLLVPDSTPTASGGVALKTNFTLIDTAVAAKAPITNPQFNGNVNVGGDIVVGGAGGGGGTIHLYDPANDDFDSISVNDGALNLPGAVNVAGYVEAQAYVSTAGGLSGASLNISGGSTLDGPLTLSSFGDAGTRLMVTDTSGALAPIAGNGVLVATTTPTPSLSFSTAPTIAGTNISGILKLTGGTLTGSLSGTSANFSSLTIGGLNVLTGTAANALYLSLTGGTLTGPLSGTTSTFTTSMESPLHIGGTTSGAALTLRSTTHATKGQINFGVGTNTLYQESTDTLQTGNLYAQGYCGLYGGTEISGGLTCYSDIYMDATSISGVYELDAYTATVSDTLYTTNIDASGLIKTSVPVGGGYVEKHAELSTGYDSSFGNYARMDLQGGDGYSVQINAYLNNAYSWDWRAGGGLVMGQTTLPGTYSLFLSNYYSVSIFNNVGGTVPPSDASSQLAALWIDRRTLLAYTTSGDDGSTRLQVNGSIRHTGALLAPNLSSSPTAPTTSQTTTYTKGGKYVIAYNDAGTTKYRYMDLTSTNATWTYTTTAP